jgi:hypothetical protein
MDKTADQIEAHIERTRERLGSNFRELENKVEAATDWRGHFRQRPHLFLGAAVIGGMVLASAFKSKSGGRVRAALSGAPVVGGHGSVQGQARELWDNVQGALLGVATARITDYVADLVPGFDEHYRQAEHRAATMDRSRS